MREERTDLRGSNHRKLRVWRGGFPDCGGWTGIAERTREFRTEKKERSRGLGTEWNGVETSTRVPVGLASSWYRKQTNDSVSARIGGITENCGVREIDNAIPRLPLPPTNDVGGSLSLLAPLTTGGSEAPALPFSYLSSPSRFLFPSYSSTFSSLLFSHSHTTFGLFLFASDLPIVFLVFLLLLLLRFLLLLSLRKLLPTAKGPWVVEF